MKGAAMRRWDLWPWFVVIAAFIGIPRTGVAGSPPPGSHEPSLPDAGSLSHDPGPTLSPETDAAKADCNEHPGAFLFSADYLLLRARRLPQDFAIVGPSSPFGPQGNVVSDDWKYRSGFRVGGGYRLPDEGWDVSFFYTYLHNSNNTGVTRPDGGRVFATLTHPGTVEEVDSASADSSLSYNVFDVEFGRWFRPGESLQVRVFGGPRFAQIDQGFNALYTGLTAGTGDQVSNACNFDGGGVRVGGETDWYVLRVVGLYARGSASMLVGHVRTSLTEIGNAGATSIVNVTDSFDKVIPVLELGMGVTYQHRNFRLTAGYEFVNWFGLYNVPDFVDDAHQGKLSRRTGDLGLDGLVIRAEYAY
jgi:hypothetical protein